MADTFVITHTDFDGNAVSSYDNPAGLSWTYQIGAKQPGKIEYELSEADPGVWRNAFGPKTHDAVLSMNGEPLISGPIWSVNVPFSGDTVGVVVHDWMQWLDQPPLQLMWPTDYDANDIDALITGGIAGDLIKVWPVGTTVEDMVLDILAPIDANDGQLSIIKSFTGSTFAEELTGYLERSSNQTVLSLMQTIAAMGSPYGFDFWFEPDKTLRMVGPRRTDPGSVSPIYGFYGPEDIVDGDWTNNGPTGTEILFTDGGANTKRFWHKEHAPSIAQFRRWGHVANVDGGDTSSFQIGSGTEGDFKAQAAQTRYLFPQRDLTITIKPEETIGFGNRLMEAVDVDYEKFPGCYRRIDGYFWITSQTFREVSPGSGDWLCDLGLEQIYIPIA